MSQFCCIGKAKGGIHTPECTNYEAQQKLLEAETIYEKRDRELMRIFRSQTGRRTDTLPNRADHRAYAKWFQKNHKKYGL